MEIRKFRILSGRTHAEMKCVTISFCPNPENCDVNKLWKVLDVALSMAYAFQLEGRLSHTFTLGKLVLCTKIYPKLVLRLGKMGLKHTCVERENPGFDFSQEAYGSGFHFLINCMRGSILKRRAVENGESSRNNLIQQNAGRKDDTEKDGNKYRRKNPTSTFQRKLGLWPPAPSV